MVVPRAVRSVVLAGAAVAVGAALLRVRAGLEARRRAIRLHEPDVVYGLPRGSLVPLSLRFREAAADILWVRALLYFGLRSEQARPPVAIAAIFDDLLDLDPWFRRAYRTAAFLTRYREIPRRRAVLEAVAYLDRGGRMFPDDWEFPFYAGAAYLGDMPARDSAERLRDRRLAADYVRRAVVLGMGRGAPDWLPSLAATVLTEIGEREVALRQLEDALLAAPDEVTRTKVRAKILQLRGRVEADRAAADVKDFLARWAASFPYAPLDLFVLMGERPREVAADIRTLADAPARAMLEEPSEEEGQPDERN